MTIHESSKMWDADVRKAAEEIDKLFPRGEWTSTYPGHGDDGAAYAVDFMCNKADGDAIAKYVWSNRKRLGVWYVIWYGKIISTTPGKSTWRRYFAADDPNPSKSHKNHVHVSFRPGAKYSGPAKNVTMYTTKDGVKGYGLFSSGSRVTQTRKKGFRLVGTIVTLSDGKYLRTRFGTHYPMDSLSTKKAV